LFDSYLRFQRIEWCLMSAKNVGMDGAYLVGGLACDVDVHDTTPSESLHN